MLTYSINEIRSIYQALIYTMRHKNQATERKSNEFGGFTACFLSIEYCKAFYHNSKIEDQLSKEMQFLVISILQVI